MPDVLAPLEYLQKLELYENEKPYWCFLSPHEGYDPDAQRLDNLEFEEHGDVRIEDIRESINSPSIHQCGFEVLSHSSVFTKFEHPNDIEGYKEETAKLLKQTFNAVFVTCYDTRLRRNVPFQHKQFDLNDPLLIEGPARGVHNGFDVADITYDSGPVVINRNLSNHEKLTYLKPGYRVRIVNTWRTLLPVLEDRPLALCDSRSVSPQDLIPADRIIPDRVGEVYYLTYNPNHKWYWLEKQKPTEPFAFVMYDTKAGTHARFCPHVSFRNPRAAPNAPPRESIESRSIVITKD